VREKIVLELITLDRNPYVDHIIILKKRKNKWQDVYYIDRLFDRTVSPVLDESAFIYCQVNHT